MCPLVSGIRKKIFVSPKIVKFHLLHQLLFHSFRCGTHPSDTNPVLKCSPRKIHIPFFQLEHKLSFELQMHLKHFLRLKTKDFRHSILFLWVNSPMREGCGSRCPMSICHGVNYVKDTFRINIWSGSLFFPNSLWCSLQIV